MKYLMILTVGVSLALSLAIVAQETPKPGTKKVEPLNVYLFARTVEEPPPESENKASEKEKKEKKEKEKEKKKAREKELKAKKKEAKEAYKELNKKLKKQYGKNRDDWPEEQQEEYRLAKEAETMAQFELDYFTFWGLDKVKQKDLDDSVKDIRRAMQGKNIDRKKKWLSLVETPEQAHLLVEILDRWAIAGGFPLTYILAAKISPGEGLRSDQLEGISPKKGFAREVYLRKDYRTEEPYWIFECHAAGRWRNPASCVSATIDAFIKDNRAVLMGESSIQ